MSVQCDLYDLGQNVGPKSLVRWRRDNRSTPLLPHHLETAISAAPGQAPLDIDGAKRVRERTVFARVRREFMDCHADGL